jgi:hypothetical protein
VHKFGSRFRVFWFQLYILKIRKHLKIVVFLDFCHMIKLVRNTLGNRKHLKTDDVDISWECIVQLHDLQKNEGLRLANKLTSKHTNFVNNRTNVRLAMQVLSESLFFF